MFSDCCCFLITAFVGDNKLILILSYLTSSWPMVRSPTTLHWHEEMWLCNSRIQTDSMLMQHWKMHCMFHLSLTAYFLFKLLQL